MHHFDRSIFVAITSRLQDATTVKQVVLQPQLSN